jgi:hypothetical protein
MDQHPELYYLSPAQVVGPLAGGRLEVHDRDDKKMGKFAGIILDPEACRLRYIVLDTPGFFRHRRLLVPADPTQVDVEHRALRVGIDSAELSGCTKFDPRVFADFAEGTHSPMASADGLDR